MIKTEDPINIAYSGTKLLPHMDLVYYESPPGLQLLHCLRLCMYVCVCACEHLIHCSVEMIMKLSVESHFY